MAVSGRLKIYEDSAWQYTGYGMSGTSGMSGYSGNNKYPWKGQWVSPGPYDLWDCVEYDGTGYVCIQAATTEVPGTDNDFWSAFSRRGFSGYSGISGWSGRSGYSGYSGMDGLFAGSGYSGYSGQSGYSGYSAAGFLWMGAWSSLTTYAVNDTVQHNGNGYICIQATTSNLEEPGVDNDYWSLFVEKGFSGYSGLGLSGYSGAATSGYSGYSSDSGISGYSGMSGYSGANPGESGYSGYSGYSGISGYSGWSGDSGRSGYSGFGTSGYSGYSGSLPVLSGNTTVNFNSSQTAAQIQALIGAQPKNLGGYVLTFQFADGTYTLSSGLSFAHFHSGQIRVQGNTGEALTLHTNQAVILDFTSGTGSLAFTWIPGSAYTYITNLKVMINTSASHVIGIFSTSFLTEMLGCYIVGNSTTYGYGMLGQVGVTYVDACYFENTAYAMYSQFGGTVISVGNSSTGTIPTYGLGSVIGGTLAKSGTQPTGSVLNEVSASGGVIR